ncbi:hypothetical protein K0M00_004347 [Escherichia coli]|uniref:hypothetical protein n=1 Tax=Escherichia coli TaxID=562 RepID=UPI0010B9460B|nr:hypothetical protein [Escherichia coli]EHV4443260.1 hypothetical protein [Escherichia coli]GCJ80285.1 hypothetical protein BvCmsB5655_03357 [Escherichia coli]HDS0644780.1 hypothetical protein [Escherichia coli]
MKGKYFFIENGKEVEIQEFNYNYVLNSLLKQYDRSSNKKYIYNVIVRRTYDSLGNPLFDVKTLSLDEIYFDNKRLKVLDLMKDKIHFSNIRIDPNMPVPPLEREYREWKEGRAKPRLDLVQTSPDVPAPIVLKKKPINPDDSRIDDIERWVEFPSTIEKNSVKVLDWFVNLPVCAQEIGTKIQQISERQLDLNSALQQHSDYIRMLMNNLTVALETLFPLKPTFTQKLFGKTDIKVQPSDLPKVMKALNEAVKYDTNKFSGLGTMFSELRNEVNEIKNELEYGKLGCEYALRCVDDAFEYELTLERIMKMGITTSMTETSIIATSKQYQVDMNRMVDIQTITIPLIINRLQSQTGKAVDESTVEIIRNLAYGNKE